MDLAPPWPGEVIRYAYLWSDAARAGQSGGVKDRPCAVVLANRRRNEKVHVTVVPITHSPPALHAAAVELPLSARRRLGLDDARSWAVCSEVNEFVWPGPDIAAIPGRSLSSVRYGFLSQRILDAIYRALMQQARGGGIGRTRRGE